MTNKQWARVLIITGFIVTLPLIALIGCVLYPMCVLESLKDLDKWGIEE